jgi:hypothetical protein
MPQSLPPQPPLPLLQRPKPPHRLLLLPRLLKPLLPQLLPLLRPHRHPLPKLLLPKPLPLLPQPLLILLLSLLPRPLPPKPLPLLLILPLSLLKLQHRPTPPPLRLKP